MTVVEEEAKDFVEEFFDSTPIRPTVEAFKDILNNKLFSYSRDKDKIYFMSVLRKGVFEYLDKHESKCTRIDCKYKEQIGFDKAIFTIDQELESVNEYFEYKAKGIDEFRTIETVNIHNKINEVLERFDRLEAGQEIIFEELDIMKQNFKIGKKSWFQLLQMKLLTLTTNKVLDEALVKDIFNTIMDGYNEFIAIPLST